MPRAPRTLITGGAGFLGSHLAERLLAEGHDDPRVRQPDITRARTLLGWAPTVDLETGLAKTLGYFRKLNDGGSLLGCRSKAEIAERQTVMAD